MQSQQSNKRFIIKLEKGEEVLSSLQRFCEENEIKAGSVQGIGALNNATLGFFNPKTKKYTRKEFTGDFELLSLLGNVTQYGETTKLHLHCTLGTKDFQTIGGHLCSGTISVTGEIILDPIEGTLTRKEDDEIKLPLLELS